MTRRKVRKIESIIDRLGNTSQLDETYPGSYDSNVRYRRDFAHSSTLVITTHFVKSLFGPSILGMSGAFVKGGMVFSSIGFVLMLALAAYNMKRLIINAAYLSEREGKPVRTYDEVAYVSFLTCCEQTKRYAKAFKFIINILFFLAYLHSCTIFMIFVARNIEAFLLLTHPETFIQVRHILFFQVALLMGMCTLRDLKYVAPFSFLGCALLFGSMFCAAIYCILTGIPVPQLKYYVGSWYQIFVFFSTCSSCLSGISIALTLKSSMKHPEHFFHRGGVYSFSLTAVGIFFLGFGILGYSKYGEDTKTSLMLNLPADHPLSASAKIMAISCVFLACPITFFVAFNVVWSNYLKPETSWWKVRYSEHFIRYCMIAIAFFFAIAFPDLTWMLPLKGAMFHSHLEITIPGILDYVTFYPEKGNGKYRYRQLRAIFMVFLGIFLCIGGIIALLYQVFWA